MYYIKNGIKEYYNPVKNIKEDYKALAIRNVNKSDSKFPTWIFIIIGVLLALLVSWMIYTKFINNKKEKKTFNKYK